MEKHPNKTKVEFMAYLDPEQFEKFSEFLVWLKNEQEKANQKD